MCPHNCWGLPRSLGCLARLEVLVPYVEPQSEDEELAQAGQAEVKAERLPVSIEKSHVG